MKVAAERQASAMASSEEVSFTDRDGDVSTLRTDGDGLQWWCNGRCYVKSVDELVWTTSSSCVAEDVAGGQVVGTEDVLTTAAGQPRAVLAEPQRGGERDALKQELMRLASVAGTTLVEVVGASPAALKDATARKALASLREPDAPTPGNRARRRPNGRVRAQDSKRAEVEAWLAQLRAPTRDDGSFQDCPEVSAALASLDDVLQELGCTSHSAPAGVSGSALGADDRPFTGINWANLPPSLSFTYEAATAKHDPKQPAKKTTAVAAAKEKRRLEKVRVRLEKKQRQCDSFAAAVAALNLPDGTVVGDFGCGSCGLTLPLAWAFPRLKFVGIDLKQQALELMDARAAEAGLTNVRTHCGSITSFSDPIGLVLALHACGQASDEAMLHAVNHSAPYCIAPCCIGKVKFSFRYSHDRPMVNARENPEQRKFGDGKTLGFINRLQIQNEGGWTQLAYPRSKWLASQLGSTCTTAVVAEPAAIVSSDAGEQGEEAADAISSDSSEEASLKRAEDVYAGIAAFADMSEVHGGDGELDLNYATRCGDSAADALFHRTCANIVAMDRNSFAFEAAGFETRIRAMPGLASSAKCELLIGWLPRATQ